MKVVLRVCALLFYIFIIVKLLVAGFFSTKFIIVRFLITLKMFFASLLEQAFDIHMGSYKFYKVV